MNDPYKDYVVYGPYKRPDLRSHVVLVHKVTKTKTTVSYPKYKIELKLGRILENYEEVHHMDGNVENNDDLNLMIIHKDIHASTFHIKYQTELVHCAECDKEFTLTAKQMSERHRGRNRIKDGPFCSRSCGGKFTRRNQLKG